VKADVCMHEHLPTSVTTENLWKVLREAASTAICWASSLVGDSTISIGATCV
jgi:hypothetical protein